MFNDEKNYNIRIAIGQTIIEGLSHRLLYISTNLSENPGDTLRIEKKIVEEPHR
jgi:hypothetical protein